MSESYECPVCKKQISFEGSALHNHYLDELEKSLNSKGFLTIREGKMPVDGWKAPDLFVIKNKKLLSVIDVIVGDPYENGDNSVRSKIVKINEYYNPAEIIFFEPVEYLNKIRLPETQGEYKIKCGFRPTSYKEIQKYYRKKWKKEGLKVKFWTETEL